MNRTASKVFHGAVNRPVPEPLPPLWRGPSTKPKAFARGIVAFLVAAAASCAADAAPLRIEYRTGATAITLSGRDAAQQVIATLDPGDGTERDVTDQVAWVVSPETLAAVDSRGRVTPKEAGLGTLKASMPDGTTASHPLLVANPDRERPIHFANQVVPIFTKAGCNAGGCHGKAAGQNGFRLSLLGFEPGEDYEHLVWESRGRRLFPAAPAQSLLLQKATAQLPHGGGQRLTLESEDYQLLVRWIRQGMPEGDPDAPTVTRIEVFPEARTLARNAHQQLVVTAHYSDGSSADITRSALYEAADPEIARCDELGVLNVQDRPGRIAVMIRYQAHVATFNGTVPLGAPVRDLPTSRNFVDDLLIRHWKQVGMPPSARCDDATFLRRVTLDIAGRLPSPEEVKSFTHVDSESESSSASSAEDVSTLRRDAVIERLLASSDYADYFANKWSALLRNKRTDARHTRGTYAFHDWIQQSLLENKPYDRFAREIVAAAGDLSENPPVAWYRQVRTMQAQLEDVSQLFLGQRLQCAQCHHHPYEKWSQADYWSFGAFFSRVGFKPGGQPGEEQVVHRRGVAQAKNKKDGKDVGPAALGDVPAPIGPDDDPRRQLADWMTAPSNPFFARALVNRYWKHFFGRGLVEPEDDLRATNPPTHPELLDALEAHFVASGYDLKELVRTLTRSSAYQLRSEPNESNATDRHSFARFQPRRLTAEVLYDSVHALLLSESKFEGLPPGTRAVSLPDNSFNASSYFLTVFGRPDSSSACECERSAEASLTQSLHLLNARDLQERLAADSGRAARLAADASTPEDAKLDQVYQLAYARTPTPEERQAALDHLDRAASGNDPEALAKARRNAWEDILWALLNSKEFLFNH